MKLIATLLGAAIGVFVALIGLLLVRDGWTLMQLGGSWYYLIAGAVILLSGLLIALRRGEGAGLFGLLLLATLAWALWEAGFFFWALMPRVVAPVVIGAVVILSLFLLPKDRRSLGLRLTSTGVLLGLVLMSLTLVLQYGRGTAAARGPTPDASAAIAAAPAGDWRFWGRDPEGTRFAPFDQIDTANVGELEVAWHIRTGEIAEGGSEDQNTPMQIGDTLYLCTPKNQVIAVNADTGQELWRHDPRVRGGGWNRCRGLGYYETAAFKVANAPPAPGAPAAPALAVANPPPALCGRRIVSSTIDARLFALDAATGQPCPAFGENGVVDLKVGMGEFRPSFYYPTSAPTVARDLIVIGGWVQDNTALLEPSGVVRAFSAETGELVWAWDLGNPATIRLPPAGETYTKGTPNVWSTPAFDDASGLIFLPIGNATPDYWGSHRTDAANEYNASVVALDLLTGRERWHFRTVNHDVWDWDVPSQPMLIDFPMEDGSKRAAVIQLTKRGQIFVLDRLTGQPLVETVQRQVPQDPAPGEYLAPTQPYAVGMPSIGAETIREKHMWGLTPLDQLRCRIQFRQVRYDGEFTPPGVERPSLQHPGNGGGMNWGSGSWDAVNNRLIVSVIRMPQTVQLLKTDSPAVSLDLVPDRAAEGAGGIPYRARNIRFMSEWELPWANWTLPWAPKERAEDEAAAGAPANPAAREPGGGAGAPGRGGAGRAGGAPSTPEEIPYNIPCLQPPNGEIAAIDLATRTTVWRVPSGSAEQSGPWGWRSGLDIPVGVPSAVGTIATAGGLVFRGEPDHYLRAYDARTGKVLWKAKLPVGAGANPMTFVSPATGRQYVVISAGGARRMPDRGDHVIAFALPRS